MPAIIPKVLRKIVVGVKGLENDRPVLDFVTALASESGGTVHVIHVRERRCSKGGPCYSETIDDASRIVEDAVFGLRMAGIGASGRVIAALDGRAAKSILELANAWGADAIVVGWRKSRGLRRVFRTGDRQSLMRRSSLPVILAPLTSARQPADVSERLPARSKLTQ
jgi:nucleotide-binding universal stress UspA family protein